MSMKEGSLLIVDDDIDVLHTARVILKPYFKNITVESNPQELNYLIKNETFDVIILDMNYTNGATTGKEGLFWLKYIIESIPDQLVIMMTAYGDIKLAVEAMKFGANDFVVKPWENEKFIATINSAYSHSQAKKELKELKTKQSSINKIFANSNNTIIGESKELREVLTIANKVAATDASVLILGENGVGKEVIAQHIHNLSDRADEPFIKVDLGSISASLFESELFGHVKGAFTDAKSDKEGRLALAGNGTLFLDEIGNLPLAMQSKLLSVLQNKQVIPVGSTAPKPINARIISATNSSLAQMIEEKTFREDLLYRLNTVEIRIPALRERPDDIALLSKHYLSTFSKKYNKVLSVEENTINYLAGYHWPGNVRELMHAIERAVIMSDGSQVTTEDFILKNVKEVKKTDSLNVDEVEKELIQKALLKHHGNVSKAAKELGMGRTTIYRKMEKHNINY
ncbi:MAG: sigma-54 dependent transcriptional regulator [Fulvivirga sp.]|uniref:sigma-54-dependent transcriptional regulator n=1 Tax=Fulvivirga sp. TaxID=1931237 RepID=UPI0032EFE2FD